MPSSNSTPAVTAPSPACDEQVKCEAALRNALGHAIRVGELLIEAKALVAHGAWQPWLSEHFRGPERTARGWMQLAREAKRATVADLGLRGALAALAAPREEHAPQPSTADEAEEVSGEIVDPELTSLRAIFDRLRTRGRFRRRRSAHRRRGSRTGCLDRRGG